MIEIKFDANCIGRLSIFLLVYFRYWLLYKRVYLKTDNNYTTINDNKYNIRGVVHINDSETPNPTLPYYDKTSYIYNI